MKIRTGFVSNSSSSSFTCGVCGNTQSGWDLCLSEAGMVECVNGHTLCEDHQKSKFDADRSIAEKREILLQDQHCSIQPDSSDAEVEDMFDDWIGEARYCIPATMCPFCSLDNVLDDLLVKYLLKSADTTRESVIQQIRQQFESYDLFKAYVQD